MSGIYDIHVAGVKVTMANTRELLDWVEAQLNAEDDRIRVMASGNVHSLNMAQQIPWFKQYLNSADVVRLDGAGVGLAARIYGIRPPARSTWADFGWPLLERFAGRGTSVFYFGCAPGIAEKAAEVGRQRFPSLQVVGVEHGFIDWKDPDSADNANLVRRINDSGAQVLIIGLGMPRQEEWILAHRDRLQVKLIMTGGAVFNYLAGIEKRAPKWMLRYGLEWLFRFLLEPKRMFRRYIIGNPSFMIRVLVDVVRSGKR